MASSFCQRSSAPSLRDFGPLDREEAVVGLRVEGQGQVRGQGPGSGRPDDREDVLAGQGRDLLRELVPVCLREGEADVDGRAHVVLVVLDLGLGQGGAARDAPVDRLLGLVDQVLVHEAGELSDDRGLVARGHREVGVVPLAQDPEALELRPLHPHELLGVLAAGPAELHRRHLPLLRPQGAVDLQLDGQPVAVPARAVGGVVAGHGAAAHHDVLEHLVENGPEVDVAVGVGRPVVEDEGGPPGPGGPDLAVQVRLLPLLDTAGLHLREVPPHREVGPGQIQGGSKVTVTHGMLKRAR